MRKFLSIIICCFLWIGMSAQKPAFRLEEEKMILRIDKSWSKQQSDSVLKLYDLSRLSIDSVLRFHSTGRMALEGWRMGKSTKKYVEIYKSLDYENHIDIIGNQLWIMEPDSQFNAHMNGYRDDEFGYNNLDKPSVEKIQDSLIRFTLFGFKNAQHVSLSGSFNGWSTSGIAMKKSTEGWETIIPLKPGRYEYKFIVDGKWIRDPFNNLQAYDNFGDHNSVYFCPNKTFILPGYNKAKKVILTGTFVEWNEEAITMEWNGSQWKKELYLPPSTYLYKFIVDGREWVVDPLNSQMKDDGEGNVNSIISIGDPTLFRLNGFQNARQVLLAGTFNNWNMSGLSMEKRNGGWELPYVLTAGNYAYKFIVDGNWLCDPNQPIINTKNPVDCHHLMVIEPNHTFILQGFQQAQQVIVTGSFNDWNETHFPLRRSGDRWELKVHLPEGKTTYKFIVDGQWILDPHNNTWEENEYGTGNSVIWLK